MEYFTFAEQEEPLRERYQQRLSAEQDRIRMAPRPLQEIQEEDRRFFVEPEGVYFGEVKPEAKCSLVRREGGGTYEVDPIFFREVQAFVQRHPRYMIVFEMRRGYSRRAGVYPARMIVEDEELCLEEASHV